MPFADLWPLAQQGNPQALEAVFKMQNPEPSWVIKVRIHDNCLQILLEAESTPDQRRAVALIRSFLAQLQPLTIAAAHTVRIWGRRRGQRFADWVENLALAPYLQPPAAPEPPLQAEPVTTDLAKPQAQACPAAELDAIAKDVDVTHELENQGPDSAVPTSDRDPELEVAITAGVTAGVEAVAGGTTADVSEMPDRDSQEPESVAITSEFTKGQTLPDEEVSEEGQTFAGEVAHSLVNKFTDVREQEGLELERGGNSETLLGTFSHEAQESEATEPGSSIEQSDVEDLGAQDLGPEVYTEASDLEDLGIEDLGTEGSDIEDLGIEDLGPEAYAEEPNIEDLDTEGSDVESSDTEDSDIDAYAEASDIQDLGVEDLDTEGSDIEDLGIEDLGPEAYAEEPNIEDLDTEGSDVESSDTEDSDIDAYAEASDIQDLGVEDLDTEGSDIEDLGIESDIEDLGIEDLEPEAYAEEPNIEDLDTEGSDVESSDIDVYAEASDIEDLGVEDLDTEDSDVEDLDTDACTETSDIEDLEVEDLDTEDLDIEDSDVEDLDTDTCTETSDIEDLDVEDLDTEDSDIEASATDAYAEDSDIEGLDTEDLDTEDSDVEASATDAYAEDSDIEDLDTEGLDTQAYAEVSDIKDLGAQDYAEALGVEDLGTGDLGSEDLEDTPELESSPLQLTSLTAEELTDANLTDEDLTGEIGGDQAPDDLATVLLATEVEADQEEDLATTEPAIEDQLTDPEVAAPQGVTSLSGAAPLLTGLMATSAVDARQTTECSSPAADRGEAMELEGQALELHSALNTPPEAWQAEREDVTPTASPEATFGPPLAIAQPPVQPTAESEAEATEEKSEWILRPEIVIVFLLALFIIIWQTYEAILEEVGDSDLSLSSSGLARRLNTTRRTINRIKKQPNFSQWTQSRDPDAIAWVYGENGRFTPVLTLTVSPTDAPT
ncbi:hypothetical protein OOK60_03565 [Trichothermofontia sichuanensis B231]|uniref:hypothetical protein n=1 Tax=Trichothermofontia sichuanensis TaxID=3045816 RepID=UPI00224852F1|nr:hypothetical protein [Trichothermofontia sichuanensis]UZQ55166.1 hypothetical protein OOK60_03565 [Trichothermofontia sichuanensis B231]